MNQIYWDLDKISILTDTMDASSHSHAMMQFFICIEGDLNLKVAKEKPAGKCILVNKNVKHSFKTDNKICFTVIIEPVSDLGLALDTFLADKDCYVVDDSKADSLIACVMDLTEHPGKEAYVKLMDEVCCCFELPQSRKKLDDRIVSFLDMLDHCSCHDHSIDKYASELCLSSSRLSHLFSEQVGIPLKKYLILHQLERAFEEILQGTSITKAAMVSAIRKPLS